MNEKEGIDVVTGLIPGLNLGSPSSDRSISSAMSGIRVSPLFENADQDEGIIVTTSDESDTTGNLSPNTCDAKDAFAGCLDEYGSPLPGITEAKGAQGRVLIGCPDATHVRKTMSLESAQKMFRSEWKTDPETFRARFESVCKELTPALNAAADRNSVILHSTCTVLCNETDSPTIVIDQELAKGLTLKAYVKKLNEEWSEMKPNDQDMAISSLKCATIQILSGVDTLYRLGLYHNDLHANNIILRPLTSPLALPIGTIGAIGTTNVARFSPGDCLFHVAIIDYGLATKGAPLNRAYKRTDKFQGYPPLLDLCHFYTSLMHIEAPDNLFNGVNSVLGTVCQAGLTGERASSAIQAELALAGRELDLKQANSIYNDLISQVLKPEQKSAVGQLETNSIVISPPSTMVPANASSPMGWMPAAATSFNAFPPNASPPMLSSSPPAPMRISPTLSEMRMSPLDLSLNAGSNPRFNTNTRIRRPTAPPIYHMPHHSRHPALNRLAYRYKF